MFQWLISFLRKLAVFRGFKTLGAVDVEQVVDTGGVPAERTGSGQDKENAMTTEQALAAVSIDLGVPPDWLRKLIAFESNWNPLARNPYTGARGLIQFMPKTAQALGFKDAEDLVAKHPDAVSQLLNPVKAYFHLPGNRPPYPTAQSLYMTVFYPAARSWAPGTMFADTVRSVNPGIDTVADYVRKVEKRPIVKTGIGLAAVAVLAGITFLIYKHFQKGGIV